MEMFYNPGGTHSRVKEENFRRKITRAVQKFTFILYI